MTVHCPLPQWPSDLLEAGPAEDPTILLRSAVEIGAAAYSLLAVRIDPIRMKADLRGDVRAGAYRSHQLDELLDDLSSYTTPSDRSLVHLETGDYILLMIPADDE